MSWPIGVTRLKGVLSPGRPVDRRALLRLWSLALVLLIAVGLLGWQLGRLAAPVVVRLQIEVIDSVSDAPPPPELPTSPFIR